MCPVPNIRYSRLSIDDRETIAIDLARGKRPSEIASRLNRSPSTITREIRRNIDCLDEYRAIYAQKRFDRNSSLKRLDQRKISLGSRLRRYIHLAIRLKNSPQQIANRLKRDYPNDVAMQISHESIYAYLYAMPKGELKKSLLKELRRKHKHRRGRKKLGKRPKPLKDMVLIDQRPAEVEGRAVPGHWEGDLLIGKNRQSALGVLLERKTRFTLLVPLKNRTSEVVRKAFGRAIMKIPKSLRKSLTYDQGREMADHKGFTRDTDMPVYFAHPASPWEKGSTENTNGLIRQYFPKGTNFSKVPLREVNRAQRELNARPRAVLQYETPAEVLTAILH